MWGATAGLSSSADSTVGQANRGTLALLLALATAVGHAQAGPAEEYIDAQLRVVRGLEARLDSIADAADRVAKGLMTGGKIYLAGEPGMIAELLGRAADCARQGPCAGQAAAQVSRRRRRPVIATTACPRSRPITVGANSRQRRAGRGLRLGGRTRCFGAPLPANVSADPG